MRSERYGSRKAGQVDLVSHRKDFSFYYEMRSQRSGMTWTLYVLPGINLAAVWRTDCEGKGGSRETS